MEQLRIPLPHGKNGPENCPNQKKGGFTTNAIFLYPVMRPDGNLLCGEKPFYLCNPDAGDHSKELSPRAMLTYSEHTHAAPIAAVNNKEPPQ